MNLITPSALNALRERARACLQAGGHVSVGMPEPAPSTPPADRAVPLTAVQEGLWYIERLRPGTGDAHVSLALRLTGPLDRERLARSVARCVAEHPALRSTVIELDGRPHLLARAPAAALRLLDMPSGAEEPAVRLRLLDEARRPFALQGGPLFRAVLLCLSDDAHVLLLVAHHLVIDGWSLGILLGDIAAAWRDDTAAPRTAPAVAYYQAFGTRAPAPTASDLAAWRGMLAGERERLVLPNDRETEATTSISLALPGEQIARVDAACRSLGLTRFPVLAAAVALVVGRYGAQRDITLGFPLARRSGTDAQALVGNCLRTLPLRIDGSTDLTFADLAARAQVAFAGALSHAEVPMTTLAREYDPHRDEKRSPLFDVLVNLTNFPMPAFDLAGQTVCYYDVDEPELSGLGAAKLPLTVYAEPLPTGGVRLRAVAQGRHFSRDRLALLLERLALVLDTAAANTDIPIDEIDLCTPACRALLPSLATPLPAECHTSALAAFVEQVERRPNAAALHWRGGVDDYRSVSTAAALLCEQLLHEADAGDRSPVAVLGERSPAVVAATLAAWGAGVPVVLVDSSLPPQRIATMLAAAGARRGIAVGAVAFPDGHGLRVIATPARLVPGERPLAVPDDTDDAAYIAFTSGSTGQPKAILGSHNGLGQFLSWQRQTFGVGPGDRVAHVTSLSFDVVLRELFLPLSSGACLCIPDSADLGGRAIGEFLAGAGVTRLHAVPTLAKLWLRAWATAPATGSALRTVFFAGEPLLDTLVESWRQRFNGCEVINLYGPTETTLAKCFSRVETPARPGVQPIGAAINGSQALVLNDCGRVVGRGEVGEIVIRSPYRSLGYLVDGALTDTFRVNPKRPDEGCTLYASGDLGRFGMDGVLEILGRRDDQVKIHGVRIELPELRAALQSHTGVEDGYVTTRGERDHKELVAFAVPRAPDLTAADIFAHLRAHLPAAMVPAQVLLVEALRRLPNGKIDRKYMLALARDARATAKDLDAPQAPDNELERVIHEVWCEVLSRQHIDTRTNFFDAGGHSMLLLEAQHRLERALGHAVPVVAFFAHPSIRALATHLAAMAGVSAAEPAPPSAVQARAKPAAAPGLTARRTRLLDARHSPTTS